MLYITQKRVLDPLELELQVVVTYSVWMVGTLVSFLEEQEALNCEPPLHHLYILFVYKTGNKPVSSLFVRVQAKRTFISLLATQVRNESENTTTE